MVSKFSAERKFEIVMESPLRNGTAIAELCRKHGVSVAQFNRWRERFIEFVNKDLGESGKANEYEKQIEDLKRLKGDQALVIDALKNLSQ